MSQNQLSTLILDDDDDHARLLELSLARLSDFQFSIHKSSTIDQAIELIDTHDFDLIFVDYRLGGETGESFVNDVRQKGLDIPIICITAVGDHYAAADVTRAGAQRFMLKSDIQSPLLKTMIEESLQTVEESRSQMAPQLQAKELIERLTPREKQVLELIVEGLLSKQIALKLGCAEGTIKLHRSRMLDKTGSQTTGELVRIAMLARGHLTNEV
ncbi:MAG: response regulator transcription factor [Phycisphaeraceae bacterium JB051]